jgi:hypothetical protein
VGFAIKKPDGVRIRNIRHKLEDNTFYRSRAARIYGITTRHLYLTGDTFETDSGVWVDSSGYQNDFIAYNNPTSDGNGGVIFSGSGQDYFSLNVDALNQGAPVEIDVIFTPSFMSNSRQGIFNNWDSEGYGIGIGWDSSSEYAMRVVAAFHINGSYKLIKSNDVLVIGQEYHVIVRYDGTQLTMSVDGVLQNDVCIVSGSIKIGGYPFEIGSNAGVMAAGEYFYGTIKSLACSLISLPGRINL